jgi:hypothetical protein
VLATSALALDLGLANARHVVTVPQAAFEGTPRTWEVIREAEKAQPSPGPFRVQRLSTWWPGEWLEERSLHRTEELIRWERGTLRPLYSLPLGIELTFCFDTTDMYDYGTQLLPWSMPLDPATAASLGLKPGDQIWYYPRRGFDVWNTRYFIVPSYMVWDVLERGFANLLARTTGIYPPLDAFDGPGGKARQRAYERSDDVRVLRNESALPRAWIVHRARVSPPVRRLRQSEFASILDEMLFENDAFWHDPRRRVYDPHEVAWVETDRPDAVTRFLSRARPDTAETAVITRADPQRIEVRATVRSAGLLVLADVYYPGWTVTVDGRPAEILRTNRAMRGVLVPAGEHRLVFLYQPLSFRAGLVLSGLGLVVLMALAVWARSGPPLSVSDPAFGAFPPAAP